MTSEMKFVKAYVAAAKKNQHAGVVANKLDLKVSTVYTQATKLRMQGVALPKLPRMPETRKRRSSVKALNSYIASQLI